MSKNTQNFGNKKNDTKEFSRDLLETLKGMHEGQIMNLPNGLSVFKSKGKFQGTQGAKALLRKKTSKQFSKFIQK
jgi:hypothetical protein